MDLALFFNDLDEGIKCTPIKYAGKTKPDGVADTLQDGIMFQNDLDELEKWHQIHWMKFIEDKCKQVLLFQMNKENGNDWPGCHAIGKDLGSIVDHNLSP